MANLIDAALDGGPDYIVANGDTLHVCSSEPANYAAIAAATLASTTVTLTKGNGDTSGRKVTCPAQTGVTASGTGTATHWVISNGTDTLIASNTYAASFATTSSQDIDLPAFDVAEFRDAVSE